MRINTRSLLACLHNIHTLLPQVRLKRFLEMRGADGGPWRMICALPALWVGLIYEPQAQREALELISSWTQDDRDYLRTGGSFVLGLTALYRLS
jgi:glutamate--cysteine ligase